FAHPSLWRDARMAFSLIPKEMKFFDMFDEAAAIITRASEIFLDMLTNFDRGPNPGEGFQAPAGLSAQPLPIVKAHPSDRVAQRFGGTMKDIDGIPSRLREITKLENEADQVYRETDAALFANPPDVLHLIKLRELYGWLEETVDACKDVSMIISEIVIKGS